MNEQAPAAEGSFAKQWIGNDLDDLAGRHPQRGIVNARTVKRPSSDEAADHRIQSLLRADKQN